jgi:hypothetical protein
MLTTAPILAHPDWNEPFVVHADACKHGLGATLTQKHADGTERVIMYASKSLTEVEQNYWTWELESYACVWAVTSVFKQYLLPPYGRKFLMFTDNSAVSSIFDPAKQGGFSSRVAHWKLRLSEYDYEIKHRPGSANILADTLSRCALLSTCPYGEREEEPLYHVRPTGEPTATEPTLLATNVVQIPPGEQPNHHQRGCTFPYGRGQTDDPLYCVHPTRDYAVTEPTRLPTNAAHFPPEDLTADNLAQFVEQQTKDPACASLRELIGKKDNIPFEVDSTTKALYHTARTLEIDKSDRTLRRLVVPRSLKRSIINQAHGITHAGAKRTLRLISARYHWTGMVEEITRWCACCLVCRRRKTSRPWGDGIPKTMSCK